MISCAHIKAHSKCTIKHQAGDVMLLFIFLFAKLFFHLLYKNDVIISYQLGDESSNHLYSIIIFIIFKKHLFKDKTLRGSVLSFEIILLRGISYVNINIYYH